MNTWFSGIPYLKFFLLTFDFVWRLFAIYSKELYIYFVSLVVYFPYWSKTIWAGKYCCLLAIHARSDLFNNKEIWQRHWRIEKGKSSCIVTLLSMYVDRLPICYIHLRGLSNHIFVPIYREKFETSLMSDFHFLFYADGENCVGSSGWAWIGASLIKVFRGMDITLMELIAACFSHFWFLLCSNLHIFRFHSLGYKLP